MHSRGLVVPLSCVRVPGSLTSNADGAGEHWDGLRHAAPLPGVRGQAARQHPRAGARGNEHHVDQGADARGPPFPPMSRGVVLYCCVRGPASE